jgi:hypothetical protein
MEHEDQQDDLGVHKKAGRGSSAAGCDDNRAWALMQGAAASSREPCHMRLKGLALIADKKSRNMNAAAARAAVRGHRCIVYVRDGRGLMVGVCACVPVVCACFDFFFLFFSFFLPKRIGNYVINTNML